MDRTKYLGKDPYLIFPPDQMVDQVDMPFPSGRTSVDWGMSLVWLGDHYLLTADHNTTPGLPTQIWRIIAIQDVPLLKAGQMFAFGTCRDGGEPAPRVLAVVVYDGNQQWFDRIVAAWGYDPAYGEFSPYPTSKLTCYNPRYGLGLDNQRVPSTAPATASATGPVSAPAAASHTPPH